MGGFLQRLGIRMGKWDNRPWATAITAFQWWCDRFAAAFYL